MTLPKHIVCDRKRKVVKCDFYKHEDCPETCSLAKKSEEGICGYYKNCRIKDMIIRDCTKPAYENCNTYKAWEESFELGIGAIVVPVNMGEGK